MKITKEIWNCGELERIQEFKNISDAIEHATEENEKLRELVGRLCEVLFNDQTVGTPQAQLQHVLGYGYEVEE